MLTSVHAATKSCISIPASASATDAQIIPADKAIKILKYTFVFREVTTMLSTFFTLDKSQLGFM